MICTPKSDTFGVRIFNWQRKDKNFENTGRFKLSVIMDMRKPFGYNGNREKYDVKHDVISGERIFLEEGIKV